MPLLNCSLFIITINQKTTLLTKTKNYDEPLQIMFKSDSNCRNF
jgi:hypothetical protein